ncbi:TolC family outer membrane protein [Vibrio tubiashii]|uniref:Agglutination protein n=1 Tax=Vibrio tubiashii ATCC 19109 TaxID=1051646 RepID=F9T2X6_9VIBR|nr:TolC family outer membrane protein [Vibrio tubiashii]AIW14003.1 agglutination protein [Vibrio tubiashii ATCC 19109]EGU57355.1 type I secretion outer membrane [Vibrio tubiashii ATCC 19109]EIF01350.1 type I secretion outer membrane [Vibrio tubiashii NCIMB 1337 = ATCC 19106]MCG9577275.1 TolC family outer membrane protein [Vibrio tubiashii]MCG9582631.1 TolC family outer membrane protein [Vibrio tubiashii]
MNWNKLKVLSCAVALSFPAHSQTLEQAVAFTITTNPEIKASYNEFKSKFYDAEASGGAYMPKLDLDAGIGFEAVDPATTAPKTELTRKEATLTLTQLLWDGSATLNDMDRTAADAESVRFQLMSDAQDIALQVTKIYLDATKAYEVLALSESNLAVHKEIYSDIKKRVDSGIGSTADLSQVEARLAKAHGNLLAAQNNLFDVHTQFKRIVGQSPQGLTFPRADQTAIPFTVDEALDTAFNAHPVIKVAQADVDSARFQYDQTKGVNYPTLSIEANQTWRDDAGGIRGSSDEFSAMLRMRYNLYNGGSDSDRTESAAYQLNKAKDFRDRTYRSVEEGLRLSWSALDLTVQQKDFLADHVDSASDTVIAYEKQYKLGKRTLLDLLNTENELFEARKGYLDAKYDEQYAKYRVMNATGNLLAALRVDTPQEWNEKVEY